MPPFKCPRCVDEHETILACPYVKAVEFLDGYVFGEEAQPIISRVEFLTPRDYGPSAGGEKSPEQAGEQAGYPTLGP